MYITKDFLDGTEVKILPSDVEWCWFNPGWRVKTHISTYPTTQKKKKQNCNKFNKNFKNDPLQKNLINK